MKAAQPSTAIAATRDLMAGAQRLVVGVDGSPGAKQALRWALRAAGRSPGSEVLAALAFGPLGRPPELDVLETGHLDELVPAAEALLEKAVAEVSPSEELGAPGSLTTVTVYDEPAAGLLKQLRPSDVLVLGSRGWGRLRHLLLGSVATQCLQQHPGTVVVVRGAVTTDDRRPVLVAVDGTPDSLAALSWAANFAVRHGTPLRAVCAWSPPVSLHPSLRSLLDRQRELDQAGAELRRLVRSTLSGPGGDARSSPEVTTDVLDGSATATLTEVADQYHQLLVLGRGGPTALRRRPIGSTSLSCALHAATSVVVVEAPAPPAHSPDTAAEELS